MVRRLLLVYVVLNPPVNGAFWWQVRICWCTAVPFYVEGLWDRGKISVGILSGAFLGALALPGVVATAQPLPVAAHTVRVEQIDQGGSGSSFSGPGVSGSSTTGSSGSLNTGSQEGADEGDGSSGSSNVRFLGRVLRGVVTGS